MKFGIKLRNVLQEFRRQKLACHSPTESKTQTAHDDLDSAISSFESLEAQLKVARQDTNSKKNSDSDIIKHIDEVTSGLYTPTGAKKNNFGIPPESKS